MHLQLQKDYEKFLNALIEELDITPAQFQKAKDHYNKVSDWLSKEGSPLRKHSPTIYPQGSFRLGTVIKPVNGEDEFDVDLVCKLELTSNEITQKQLKKMIGDRLKENGHYKRMLADEGRRCWTLDYQETPKFHMDLLPAINDGNPRIWNVPTNYTKNAIQITDKEQSNYSILSVYWNKSNPIGYSNWFKDQMKVQFRSIREALAYSKNVSIEQISEDEVRTPLQRAIQILKRHRDIMFGDDEDRPISIIITTLAAHAYANEEDLFPALKNILLNMGNYIKTVEGKSVVENPVNPEENFADKWEESNKKEANFRAWMDKAREDIIELIEVQDLNDAADNLRSSFGSRQVNKAFNEAGLGYLAQGQHPLLKKNPQFVDVLHKATPPWLMRLNKSVSVSARYKDKKWHSITPKTTLKKDQSLVFLARTNVQKPFSVYWQVVNTGEEARDIGQLRGQIFPAKTAGAGGLRHQESTSYQGTHWAKCFIVKDDVCVAESEELFVEIGSI